MNVVCTCTLFAALYILSVPICLLNMERERVLMPQLGSFPERTLSYSCFQTIIPLDVQRNWRKVDLHLKF